MKQKNTFKIVLALLMLWLISNLSISVQASDITFVSEETIRIKDYDDLVEFSQKCTLDTWSRGKTVLLQADIVLEEDFLPIPSFGGIFDGKGHSISGLNVEDSMSPAGLFGVIQEGAVVKNINVNGKIEPAGINDLVGGIAGENYGEIRNCTFSGTVKGKERVGGIAGINGANGKILNCRVSGTLIGEYMTGGVCGYNQGTVEKCKNDANINNINVDAAISLENLDLELSMDMTEMNSMHLLESTMDTGGIAGYSTGVIDTCTNQGAVGYPHVGYNMGGIVGRSCGYVTGCENNGEVYGRKDVGGIVGQMEPYVRVVLSASGVSKIQTEAHALSEAVDRLERSTTTSSATFQRCVQKMTEYLNEMEKELGNATESSSSSLRVYELQKEITLLTRQMENMTKDAQSFTNQSSHFAHTVQGVMQEAEELALSDFAEDISEINLEDATLGKVMLSQNYGKVYGDMNVGGIAGSDSLEYELDPEDDLTAEFSMEERRKYQFTSIIYKCKNKAVVSAKKNYAGGICGRMDLGFVSDCESYGTIYSESGDYVGGIAGLIGSDIQDSFAKCSLSGKNYIGGIVGSGIVEDATGECSVVRDCYSLVDITSAQQFFGAIAGKESGSYVDCYFVSDELAGINRISYFGQAEPITYEQLLEVKHIPDEFESFNLTFVVDGEIVHALTFEYGDSFDEDVYPQIEGNREWDTKTLENLRKDTTVQAVYATYLTTIASGEVRSDNRAIFLAEGQFQKDDILEVVQEEIDFAVEEEQNLWEKRNQFRVLEQWGVKVPEDGRLLHTLRYLPEQKQDNLIIYVKQDGRWKEAKAEATGSYLLVNIAGTEAEIAVVEITAVWKVWAVAAIFAGVVIGSIIWMSFKKKNILRWLVWLLTTVIILVAIVLLFVLLNSKFSGSASAYLLLNEYMKRTEFAMEVSIDAKLGERKTNVDAMIFSTDLEGKQVTCIEQSGVQFFYSEGMLYLENGKAYSTSEISSDYAELLKDTAFLYEKIDVETITEKDAKTYRVVVKEENKEQLLSYLIPEVEEDSLDITTLQIDITEKEDALEQISFLAQGYILEDGRAGFSVEAAFIPEEVDEDIFEIPESVKKAIVEENTKPISIITKDVFRLYAGWKDLYKRNPFGTQISLYADCGPLTLSDSFTFISKKQDDLQVSCVQKEDFAVYFTEDKICSEKGYSVTTKRAESIEPSVLIGLAYELLLTGNFSCTQAEDIYIYSLALDEAAMKEVAAAITKESEEMNIRFENGLIQVYMREEQIESIRFACDGAMDVMITDVAVAFSAELDMTHASKYENFIIPEKAMEALGKEN